MRGSNFSCRQLLVLSWAVFLTGTTQKAESVEIECILLKSCPVFLKLLTTTKQTSETMDIIKHSFCGEDEWKQPKVWCSKLDFCKTPDDRNGTCTPMKKCKPYLELVASLNTFDYRNQHYLDQFRCNEILEGAHVCCPTDGQPIPNRGGGSTFVAPEPKLYKKPETETLKDRFYDSYPDYGDSSYAMFGDQPDFFHSHDEDSHGFHGHLDPFGPKEPHNHWHNPEYERDNTNKNVPETGYHNHKNEDRHTTTVHKRVDSHELPDYSNKRGTEDDDDYRHHEATESWSNFDRTTRRQWTAQEQTTPKNKNSANDNFGYTTRRRVSTTGRPTTSNRDGGAIVFEDSMEDFEADGGITERTTSRQTVRRRGTTERPTTTTSRQSESGNRNISCETPDRKAGTCTKQNDCQPYLKLQNNLDKSKKSVKEYLSKFRCDSADTRDTYICCQKDEKKDIDNSVFNVERTHEIVPESVSKICGRQTANTDKIYGGTITALGEFPWLALLRYTSNKGTQFGCGGTLISNRHVLTAAHCVDESILKSKALGRLHQVVLGEYDTRNKTDCIYMEYGEDCADPPKTFGVESIVSHNLYSSETTRHDIALIKLNQEVKFTDYIKPICLPTNTSILKGNEIFVIAGWGKTPEEPFSPVLRKAKIPYVRKQVCDDRSIASRALIEGQICAGIGNGTDSCNGDSGGPVMLEVNFNFEFVTHLVGIISYGISDCGAGPSVNTYVPYYIDWIREKMR